MASVCNGDIFFGKLVTARVTESCELIQETAANLLVGGIGWNSCEYEIDLFVLIVTYFYCRSYFLHVCWLLSLVSKCLQYTEYTCCVCVSEVCSRWLFGPLQCFIFCSFVLRSMQMRTVVICVLRAVDGWFSSFCDCKRWLCRCIAVGCPPNLALCRKLIVAIDSVLLMFVIRDAESSILPCLKSLVLRLRPQKPDSNSNSRLKVRLQLRDFLCDSVLIDVRTHSQEFLKSKFWHLNLMKLCKSQFSPGIL